jgi:RES domain
MFPSGPLELAPDTKDRRLCSACVGEPRLRAEVEGNGQNGTCSYCNRAGKTFSIDQAADRIESVLTNFCYLAARELGEGGPVADMIDDLAKIGPEAAEDVRRALAEQDAASHCFDPDAHYGMRESVDVCDLESDWRDFESSLKHESRYFNRHGEKLFSFLFEGMDRHKTTYEDQIVVKAGPGTKYSVVYRARQFEGEEDLRRAMERPHREVGPPPPACARANRMNAAGISVFYGATDPTVALAEVRPPVGSKVLIGCFEVIRPLRLLDFVALSHLGNQQGSRFDPDYVRRSKRAEFLRRLGDRISNPVMPTSQMFDYLPTQAMADFLAAAGDPPLDGIIYRSAQDGRPERDRWLFGASSYKRNVILFQKAAGVQPLDEGVEISVCDDSWSALFSGPGHFDDAPNLKYSVTVGSEAPSQEMNDAPLKLSSLEVHYVSGVRFDTLSSPVPRYYRVGGTGATNQDQDSEGSTGT